MQLLSADRRADRARAAAQVEHHPRLHRAGELDQVLGASPRHKHARRDNESDAAELRPPQHDLQRLAFTPRRNHAVDLGVAPRRREDQRGLVLGENAAGGAEGFDDVGHGSNSS